MWCARCNYPVSKMYFPSSHMHQDKTLSWHNCMFSPHRGSKPQCKDYTCSRTKVTAACRTLIHPLSQQVEDAQLVKQKTVGKEMRASSTKGAECCPEQLDSVPKHGAESLCSILRLCIQSRAPCPALWAISATSILTLPCSPRPLQLCRHSSLSPSFSLPPCPASLGLRMSSSSPWNWQ